ncbi:MAG TPA: hypothetical protein VFI06_09410 [Chitinophagaceae bacterium]|nr:hypothetical protein [Chitinophagaceae bacterium]
MDELDDIIPMGEMHVTDPVEIRAREKIIDFFEANKEKVFYSRQVEVIFEDNYFHWITNRVLRRLAAERKIRFEKRPLKLGTTITLYWHPSFRYYKREASYLVDIVNKYSESSNSVALGDHGENLVIKGFAKFGYIIKGLEIKEYGGRSWTDSDHDLDIIMEKDNIGYGVEIKNKLSYIDKDEFDIKIKICHHLRVKPVFVNRMLPAIWIEELRSAGGFALILKYQLYPRFLSDQARILREHLSLPVDSPKALMDGTIQRFENWHKKNVNSKYNSHKP